VSRLPQLASPNTIIIAATGASAVASVRQSVFWVSVFAATVFAAHCWGELRQRKSARTQVDALLLYLSHYVFGSSPRFRFSIFTPDRHYRSVSLVRRFQYGYPISSGSGPTFERGVGLAGAALQHIGKFLEVGIPDFAGNRGAFHAHYLHVLQLPPHIVNGLSGFMVGVRAIGCIGIAGYYSNRCVAVLSIDSLDPTPFSPHRQNEISRVAVLLSMILEA